MNIIKENATEKIKGVVNIYEDNKLIMQKHNLIVADGRKFIKDIFESLAFAKLSENTESSIITAIGDSENTYKNYKFYKICFGETGKNIIATTPELKLEDLVRDDNVEFRYLYNSGDTSKTASVWSHMTDRYFKIALEFSGTIISQKSISEIYITIAEYEDGFDENKLNEKLFSRVVFDPRVVSAGSSYKIEYYIYF